MSPSTRPIARRFVRVLSGAAAVCLAPMLTAVTAQAFTIRVFDAGGNPVPGFRYLVEIDNTNQPTPGVPETTVISLTTHKSHARVRDAGHSATHEATVDLPDGGRYFVSVLPDAGFTMSGAPRDAGQGLVWVTVHSQPVCLIRRGLLR